MSSLRGDATYLARADVFSVAQAEDLLEGEGKRRRTEACRSAVVDGPHEPQRPGSHQLHQEDPGYETQAAAHAGLRALGVLQQSSNQYGLEGRGGADVINHATHK